MRKQFFLEEKKASNPRAFIESAMKKQFVWWGSFNVSLPWWIGSIMTRAS
jgi:hypothetical protein